MIRIQYSTNPKDGARMVYVPPGKFLMGMSEKRIEEYCAKYGTHPDNMKMMRPQRTVYLDGFWIYEDPVTFGQYRAFCQANRKYQVPISLISQWPDADLEMDDDYPVTRVSWNDANAYCKWAGAELPTEAQWEKAARGTEAALYPWGDEWDPERANFDYRKEGQHAGPVKVDQFPGGTSPYGARQMSGNVLEWCHDNFAPYGHTKPLNKPTEQWAFQHRTDISDEGPVIENPRGPLIPASKVARGGGWVNPNADWVGLAAFRKCFPAKSNHQELGFRPVIPA